MELYVFVWSMYNRHVAQNSKSVDDCTVESLSPLLHQLPRSHP